MRLKFGASLTSNSGVTVYSLSKVKFKHSYVYGMVLSVASLKQLGEFSAKSGSPETLLPHARYLLS